MTTPSLTEAQLSAIWAGQRFPEAALVTRQGVPVRVISRGRAGRGPGPDFRGAVLSGPSGLSLRGDVELHVRASHFRLHGHVMDPDYANIVLHVVFEDDTGEDTPLFGGRSAPVVALAPWVARRAGEIERWLDQPPLWREPCTGAPARLGADRIAALIGGMGDARFAAKVERMRERIGRDGPAQAIYEALLEALGYSANVAPMRALARGLPWDALRAATGTPPDRGLIEASLLRAGGLAGAPRPATDAREARSHTDPPASPSPEDITWRATRPQNAPALRIAAAAALLARHGAPPALLALVRHAASPDDILRGLVVPGGGEGPRAPLGRDRALEIALNVLLPAAAASGDEALAARARALYAALPRPASYGATRFLERALLAGAPRTRRAARSAQGLLALHRDWCTQNGCGKCPFS